MENGRGTTESSLLYQQVLGPSCDDCWRIRLHPPTNYSSQRIGSDTDVRKTIFAFCIGHHENKDTSRLCLDADGRLKSLKIMLKIRETIHFEFCILVDN